MILKVVLRNFRKRLILNIIKVTGLSLSLACIILILLFVRHELKYESEFSQSENTYRFTLTDPNFLGGRHFARMYNPSYIPDFAESQGGIDSYVRMAPIRGGLLQKEQEFVSYDQGFMVDSTFLDVFDVGLLFGDVSIALDKPSNMIVSEGFAEKVFGDEDPVGQLLSIPAGQHYGEEINFEIVGVMPNFPGNSHMHPDFVCSPPEQEYMNFWAWVYLVLNEGTDPVFIEEQFKPFFQERFERDAEDMETIAHLQAIKDIHLYSKKTREIEPNSDMNVVYSFAIAALLLLMISLINYTNLNVGMRDFSLKFRRVSGIFGASEKINTQYHFAENLFSILLSVVLSYLILYFSLESMRNWYLLDLGKGSALFVLVVTGLFVVLCLLSGLLSTFQKRKINALILSDSNARKGAHKGLSGGLILFQNAVAIGLIIAVIVIRNQTEYAMDLSMNTEDKSIIDFKAHASIQKDFVKFKDELLKYNSIDEVSAMMEPPGGEANDMMPFELEGFVPDENVQNSNYIGVFPCDYSFASIFDLEFLAGENFSESYEDNEGSAEYIINEAALVMFGYSNSQDIIGKEFDVDFHSDAIQIPSGKISGVVKNFYLSSLKREVDPIVLFKRKDLWLLQFAIAFNPANQEQALSDIHKVWKELFPEYPLQYEYVDDMYHNVYKTEILQVKLLSIFTVLSLLICTMGLIGLSLLNINVRTKEIGIRKVNGATTLTILGMLNWDFLKWILLSNILAVPLSYFAMNRWLEDYAYRVGIPWWSFVLAALAALTIAALSITVQGYRMASKNPVEALRYE